MPQPRRRRPNGGAAAEQQATSVPAASAPQRTLPPPPRKAAAPPAPTRQPATTAANKGAQKTNAKKKKANPNSTTPFNHRARFTKFKRSVHAQRRWAASQLASAQVPDAPPSEASPAAAPASPASSVAEEWDSDQAGHDDRTALPRFGVDIRRSVAAMDALYARLDAAMKARRFRRAGTLKRAIRARQGWLRRQLRSQGTRPGFQVSSKPDLASGVQPHESNSSVASGAAPGTCVAAKSPGPYRSFHPPSTWMGLGRHPRSAWVDQRTGRYPQRCSDARVQAVTRCFMDGRVADGDGVPEACAGMVPIASSCAAALPSATAVSRSQRAMRAPLFAATYCANVLTDGLEDLCFTLLQGLHAEQLELRQRQPLQFKARQRYVVGFQEVLKCLRAGRVRLVLLATDVEAIEVAPSPPAQPVAGPSPAAATAAPPSRQTRRKAFQTLHEAVQLVQQSTGSGSGQHGTRAPPLCVTCMSRERLSYALHAKGSKVSCVAVLQAEKNREALKAVTCYGRYLASVYAAEMEAARADRGGVCGTVAEP